MSYPTSDLQCSEKCSTRISWDIDTQGIFDSERVLSNKSKLCNNLQPNPKVTDINRNLSMDTELHLYWTTDIFIQFPVPELNEKYCFQM